MGKYQSDLMKEYMKYAHTPEAHAVLFVKHFLKQADNQVWVDILDYRHPWDYGEHLFSSVQCELFSRLTQPVYPKASKFGSREAWISECRARTWEAANRDIATYHRLGHDGRKYLIRGGIVIRKSGPSTWTADDFIPGTPPEVLKLLDDLNDRTDPLWDDIGKYLVKKPTSIWDDYRVYSIKRL